MKYYSCINCGYHGNFSFYRQRNVVCEICKYNDISELTEEEYNKWAIEKKQFQDESIFYKTKGRLNDFGQPVKNREKK